MSLKFFCLKMQKPKSFFFSLRKEVPIFLPRRNCRTICLDLSLWRIRCYPSSRSWCYMWSSGFHFRPNWMKMIWRWSLRNIIKWNVLSNLWSETYVKSDVLSIMLVLIALITDAKHWFSITSTFLLVSATSLTVQSLTYLKNQIDYQGKVSCV